MHVPHIIMIGTSPELCSLFAEVAAARGLEIQTHIACLDDAVPFAMDLIDRGLADVLVASRGTAEMLRKKTSVPVLPIALGSLNLAKVLFELAPVAKSVFFAQYENEDVDFSFFERQTGVKVHCARYADLASLEEAVRRYVAGDTGIVVGGGQACAIAARLGASYRVVIPTRDEIAVTLSNAWNIAQSVAAEKTVLLRYTALLDTVSESIVGTRADGTVTMANRRAQEVLGQHGSIVGTNIVSLLPGLKEHIRAGRAPGGELDATIRGTRYVVKTSRLQRPADGMDRFYSFTPCHVVVRAGRKARQALVSGYAAKYTFADYVHASQISEDMLAKLRIFARSDSTVLITGESGTGKEILAQGLHRESSRSTEPFVSVNCAAIPVQLLESEMFGYEGGSFTGSRAEGKAGLFELADGGTIFLDEINSMPLNVQALLLRTIQEQEVRRVGGSAVIPLNVRIVAATNKSIVDEVRAGRMRSDLFYRLNVLNVRVPPLRERPDDIPVLVEAFVDEASRSAGTPPIRLPQASLARLCRHPWYGNVRELKHFIEQLVFLCAGAFSQSVFDELFGETAANAASLMPLGFLGAGGAGGAGDPAAPAWPQAGQPRPEHPAAPVDVAAITPAQVEDALAKAGGRKKAAAALLGISRTSLWRILKSFGKQP
ncbi:MAG: sigma 54-interacting transcriptional regulator [Desulfovibrio sp.]|nr:sigma 54-interacting transcriptional regulator [Desulfovibrio sp.]